MQKCVAKTTDGRPCPNPAKHSDPSAQPGGPLLLCGVHIKNPAKHLKPGAGKVIVVVAAARGKDGKEEPDEMTEEEVQLHRGSSSPTLAKKASDKTMVTGISVNRLVDVVKIDNKFYVCNVTGSSKDKAGWKVFWEKHAGKPQPRLCQIKDCVKEVEATGHMYWRDDKDGKTYNYLIPICGHHNGSKNGYEWEGDATNWQACKAGLAVKIKESPKTATHAYNLRARKPVEYTK